MTSEQKLRPHSPAAVSSVPESAPATGAGPKKATAASESSKLSAKAKIQERLNIVVENASLLKNRSPELIPLMQEYQAMHKQLRALVVNVKHYGEQYRSMHKAKAELVETLGTLARDTPLDNDISSKPKPEVQEELKKAEKITGEASKVSISEILRLSEPKSLAAIQAFGSAYAVSNQQEYQDHIVAYVETWEEVVTKSVDSLSVTVRKLQGDREHYEKKVFGLRNKANEFESKDKASPARFVEKLDRNEQKLREAFVKHETEACRLCSLLEAVTHNGWIELQALCRNYIKWEANRSLRESDFQPHLAVVLQSMKGTYKRNAPKKGGVAPPKAGEALNTGTSSDVTENPS